MAKRRNKKESNYKKLFGTPERAAKTAAIVCHKCYYSLTEFCNDCPLYDICQSTVANVQEWMNK